MPSGNVHHLWWKRVTPIALLLSVTIGVTSYYVTGIFVMIGYLLGNFVTPDNDSLVVTRNESDLLHHFGLIGAIFVGYWFPYAYMSRWVGGHRSFLTHFPVVSTVIRLAYMLIPLMIYEWQWFKNENFLLGLLGIWIGLSLSDFIHWVLDMIM